ncbi:helix-turn-helix domain-containing protein [Fictibacillus fluitans]|uniref:Helix-turn-helix transcriptional regulator n=1 Tax=Fictibacillus fluitans TaxID=3058422 RepID=A0ABT8HX55_9BACL|nr:helix-turn-helix transcriptional regulator [Fictibacillus sp. NE201]MDN4525363.1 helix-turn-helix transcriptional regulator [Fictibacillus sp. NE201]
MKIKLKNAHDFKKLLIKSGYTNSSFAQKIDVSSAYVNQIVNEKSFPSPQVAKKITEELEIDFDTIFFIDDGNCLLTKRSTS